MNTSFKKYIAEFLGTFVLVFFACGTAIVTGDYTAIALAFGLVIVAMAYTIGAISGCHLNPAVSLAMFLNGRLPLNDLIGYVAAQFAGGIVASLMHLICFTDTVFEGRYGANGVYNGGDAIFGSLIVEIILTFVFVLVVLVITTRPELGNVSGIIIGLTLTLVHLFGLGITGTSVNPARSFGPAIFQENAIGDYWVFLIGPAIGAIAAAFAYGALFTNKKNTL